MLGGDVNLVSNLEPGDKLIRITSKERDDHETHQVSRVEAHSELSNHGDVGPSAESLHKGLGPGLGDGAKVVDNLDEEVQLAGISESPHHLSLLS